MGILVLVEQKMMPLRTDLHAVVSSNSLNLARWTHGGRSLNLSVKGGTGFLGCRTRYMENAPMTHDT